MFKEGDLRRRAFLRLAAMGVAATQFGVMGTARAQSVQSTPDKEGEITEAAAPTLPDYAPIPRSALGPALNDRGCCGTTIPDGRPRTRRLPITASWRSVVNAYNWRGTGPTTRLTTVSSTSRTTTR